MTKPMHISLMSPNAMASEQVSLTVHRAIGNSFVVKRVVRLDASNRDSGMVRYKNHMYTARRVYNNEWRIDIQ